MTFLNNLKKIQIKYKELARKLSTGILGEDFVHSSKEYSELIPIIEKINKYNKVVSDLKNTKEMSFESSHDQETQNMINEEIHYLEHLMLELEEQLKLSLIPKDISDTKNAIIEVRAGTGGEEAALFAASLFNMYIRYAERKKWKYEILSISDTGLGGYKEATALIKGENVFQRLKFELGVHRVQRIPETESNGRIHTSAATVAVLPEAEEIDLIIDEKDLRIDVYRASGAGGQHVNTTESAVRITHLPTNTVVTIQDEKSQHKNKAKAMKILRSRLYALEREKREASMALERKTQLGSGDRSERIRTYNFPQGRVTDHRINLTIYKIDSILKEGMLDDFINALTIQDQAKKYSTN